jgi:general secretion pathway protein B
VKVAPPRTRLPAWALLIALLLLVNLGIVAWMMLRHAPRDAGSPSPAAATALPAAPQSVAQPLAVTAAATVPAGAVMLAPGAAPPAPATAAPAAPASAAASPVAAGSVVGPAGATPGVAGAADGANPEDYAPAESSVAPGRDNHVRRGTGSGVPLYQDAAVASGTQLPNLRLDLHVYAERPQDRFVMINMHKLHEGESLPEGVHVDSITPEGAVLSYNGSRFLLTRD